MNYFKNIEAAQQFNVSTATVNRWIQGAIGGRNNLHLEEKDNRYLIIRDEHNKAEMLKLSSEGKKYRNQSSFEYIQPKNEFYKIFNEQDIFEIVRDLEAESRIDLKFTYKGVGGEYWDRFYKEFGLSKNYDTPSKEKELINETLEAIIKKLPQRKGLKVNVIDLGAGNGYPIKPILEKLERDNLLNQYIAIDISDKLLEICKDNIQFWFKGIEVFTHQMDIAEESLEKLIYNYKVEDYENTVNLVCYLGGTIGNQRKYYPILTNIRACLRSEDLFVLANAVITEKNKAVASHVTSKIYHQTHSWIVDYLGFEVRPELIESRYDDKTKKKVKYLRLEKDYYLTINDCGVKRELEFSRGSEIGIWEYKPTQFEDIFSDFKQSGLDVLNYNTYRDLSYILVTSRNRFYN